MGGWGSPKMKPSGVEKVFICDVFGAFSPKQKRINTDAICVVKQIPGRQAQQEVRS